MLLREDIKEYQAVLFHKTDHRKYKINESNTAIDVEERQKQWNLLNITSFIGLDHM